jgi:hypothetical protein
MIVAPRPPAIPPGDWIARFEPRTIDHIRALGSNSPADDRAFAAGRRRIGT